MAKLFLSDIGPFFNTLASTSFSMAHSCRKVNWHRLKITTIKQLITITFLMKKSSFGKKFANTCTIFSALLTLFAIL